MIESIRRELNSNPITTGNIKLHSLTDCTQYLVYAVDKAGSMKIVPENYNLHADGVSKDLFFQLYFDGRKVSGYIVHATLTNTGKNRWEMVAKVLERE